MAILVAMTTACSSLPERKSVGTYRIPLPKGNSVIEFPLKSFQVEKEDKTQPWYSLSDKMSGLIVSFNFEPATRCFDSKSCRDYFVKARWPASKSFRTWRTSQVGEVYLLELMFGPIGGDDLQQHHMFAHFVKDGVWVDVHLSKANYEETDRDLFLDFIRSIDIK